MADSTTKKSVFDAPLFKSRIKSADVKIWPEAALGYLVGPTLAVLSNSFMSTYINKYFSDVLALNKAASLFNTLLPIISVILVVIGNIFVGKLMDKGRSKAGKARPLLLLGAPMILIALLVMFGVTSLVPYTAGSSDGVVWVCICAALGYNLFFSLGYPMYYTAHSTMVNLSTRDSGKRSLLGTISMATQLAAIGVCQMVFPFLISWNLLTFEPTAASKTSITILGLAFGALACVGAILEFLFTRERITEETMTMAANADDKKPVVSTGQQLKACCKDPYWWIIIIFWFVYQLGGMLKNNSQLYFCQAMWGTVEGSQWSGTISIVGAIPTSVGMVLSWPISRIIGKKNTILAGACLSLVGGLMGVFFASNPIVVIVAFVIKALGSTPAMYLGLALTADMLDHEEAVYGFRCDGITMSIYGAIMVGMAGVANGVINACMGIFGYDVEQLAEHAASNMPVWNTAMTWIFLGGEAICYGIIAVMYLFMHVEKFAKVDVMVIHADQKAAAEAAGQVWVSPEEKAAKEKAENDAMQEEIRINKLKADCEKNGKDFETENNAFLAAKAEKDKAAAEKKAAAEAKKAEKEAAIPAEKKAAMAAAEQKRNEEALKELNKARVAAGRPEYVPAA